MAPQEVQLSRASTRFGPGMVLSAVRRRFRIFLATLIAVCLIALAASLLQPRHYTASAEVLLDTSTGRGAAGDGAAGEMLILQSREMATAVSRALRLEAGTLKARGPVARLFGDEAPAAGERLVVDRLLGGLSVTRMADTYALTIACTAPDPGLAAGIANEYARQYAAGRLAGMEGGVSSLDRPMARIISRAEPPASPSSPQPGKALAWGALAGLLLGVMAALLAERRFAGITSGRDISERLGLAHLGSVPVLRSVLPDATSPLDAVVAAPASGFAEAFRGLMMAIRHAGGKGTQLIAISSALPNEGKTTIAACLARSIALGGESVVLVDCDARRRDTTALFDLTARRPGLIEVLRYEATLDEALVRDGPSGAWILPLTGPPDEVSEMLGGQRMEELLEELRRRFKRVLIDTAPILAISATRAIATMADVTVLTVRWRATADHAIHAAIKLLPTDYVRIGGVVLSQVDMAAQVKIGHGDPTFYYRQYSKYYS